MNLTDVDGITQHFIWRLITRPAWDSIVNFTGGSMRSVDHPVKESVCKSLQMKIRFNVPVVKILSD
jgi:hypothetical protein